MSEPLATSISRSAAKLVDLSRQRGAGAVLDFSQASLVLVEEMASEAAEWKSTLSPDQLTTLIVGPQIALLDGVESQLRRLVGGADPSMPDTHPASLLSKPVHRF